MTGTTGDRAVDDDAFRLGFVPGVTPARWARTWRERHPGTPLLLVPVPAATAERALLDDRLDAALLRPPVDRDLLHAVRLYDEEPVVLVARDHLLAALDEGEQVALADVADEVLLQPADDVLAWRGRPGADADAIDVPGRAPLRTPETTADAVALVAAGVGVLVVPRSLARLHHRRDVVAHALPAAPAAPVALSWVIEREDDRIEDMVGIVRGRTVNSSRGRPRAEAPPAPASSPAPAPRRGGARRPARPARGRRPRRR